MLMLRQPFIIVMWWNAKDPCEYREFPFKLTDHKACLDLPGSSAHSEIRFYLAQNSKSLNFVTIPTSYNIHASFRVSLRNKVARKAMMAQKRSTTKLL